MILLRILFKQYHLNDEPQNLSWIEKGSEERERDGVEGGRGWERQRNRRRDRDRDRDRMAALCWIVNVKTSIQWRSRKNQRP